MKFTPRFGSLKFSSVTLIVFAVMLIAVACNGGDDNDPLSGGEGPALLSDGTVATATPQPIADEPAAVPDGLEIVWETYSILVREYVLREKIDPDVLAEAAVIGMLNALEDRYTAYISPSTFKIDQAGFQGKFGGIGAQVEAAPDRATPRDRSETANELLAAQDDLLRAQRNLQVSILQYLLDSGQLRVEPGGSIRLLHGMELSDEAATGGAGS